MTTHYWQTDRFYWNLVVKLGTSKLDISQLCVQRVDSRLRRQVASQQLWEVVAVRYTVVALSATDILRMLESRHTSTPYSV